MEKDITASSMPGKATREQQSWIVFAIVVVFLLLVAATRWILAHPYGIHWDEALYFDEALADLHKLHSGSVRQLASILVGGDVFRPPAYRLLALPFFAIFGFHAAIARFVTLAFWVATAAFIYVTSRCIASPVAGAVAVLVFCLAPEVLSDSIFFSTEGPFLLAIAAMLYFLWGRQANRSLRESWIGLGLAIGVGLLSKATFVLIAFPILAFALFSDRRNIFRGDRVKQFFKGGLLASVVAAPWWIKNVGPAFRYSKFATHQSRESLGSPSFVTSVKWLATVAVGLLGPAVTILIVIVVVVSVRRIFITKEVILSPDRSTVVLACICAGVPLAALQLSGLNHNLRYLAPAVVPLAVAIGVLSDITGWIRSKSSAAFVATLMVVQLLMIVTPAAFPKTHPVDPGLVNGGLPWGIMVRFEQWDWKPLRNIATGCDLNEPKISVLGMGRPLNPPQILYPWFMGGTVSSDNWFWRSQPVWLWRYSEGPIDWEKVMNLAGQTDIVVTAPDFIGQVSDKQNLDNRYNREFATRLTADPRFQGPFRLEMGRFQPVEVDVFVKKIAICRESGQEQAAR